jgi:O-antigen/teichoic acid export membrane protein
MSVASIYIDKAKGIWSHAGFQKYFKNTGWMFLGQATMIISLIINIWLARYLGPGNFGNLNYVFAFVGIFGFLTNLGINDILIRNLVRNPEKRDELLGTAFWLMMLGGILSFTAITILAFQLEPSNMIRSLIILYATTALLSPINVISAYFQATVQAKKNALAQIFGTLIVSVIKIFLIISGKGIIWLVAAFVLDYIVGTFLYLINYFKSGLKIKYWKFNYAMAKNFLQASYLLMLSAVTGYLLLKIDQVMVKFFLDETAVGIYAAAVKLSEIWYFIPGIICGSLFPAIINAKKVSESVYKNRLRKLYIFLGGIAAIIAIPMTLMATWLIQIIFGTEYILAAPILQIYVWSGVGLFLSIGINRFFMAEDNLKPIFYYSLIAVIINVSLNFILIPNIGLTGAAWATLISYSVGPILILFLSKLKKLYVK